MPSWEGTSETSLSLQPTSSVNFALFLLQDEKFSDKLAIWIYREFSAPPGPLLSTSQGKVPGSRPGEGLKNRVCQPVRINFPVLDHSL